MRRLDPATVEYLPAVIGIVFGLVFVLANRGPLPPTWSVLALLVGLALAAGDVVLLVALARRPAPAPTGAPRVRFDGRWRRVVLAEAVALVAGLVVINGVVGAPDFAVAWVALVVGVHFVALGRGASRPLVLLGTALAVLGVAGAALGLVTGSPTPVAVLAGLGSGVVLLVAVGLDLRRRGQLAAV